MSEGILNGQQTSKSTIISKILLNFFSLLINKSFITFFLGELSFARGDLQSSQMTVEEKNHALDLQAKTSNKLEKELKQSHEALLRSKTEWEEETQRLSLEVKALTHRCDHLKEENENYGFKPCFVPCLFF